MPLSEFRHPFRDVDIWGLDEYGEEMDDDDKAAAMDANQRAMEDYLTNQLPLVFIQQSGLASGTIDPAQLATGTSGTGKAPVSAGSSAPAWTDIVTQAEYDALAAASFGATFTQAADLQRGRISVTDLNGTNTVFVQTFGSTFAAVPRVVCTVECGEGSAIFPTLNAVNTTSFAGRIFTLGATSVTVTCFVHWHAVKA